MTLSAKDGRLQVELIASTCGHLAQLKVEYRGAVNVKVKTKEIAIVRTSLGEHTFEGALLADQAVSRSEKPISTATSGTSGVILVYSTYLGGSGDNVARGIAVDAAGNAYLTGATNAVNFPTQNPIQALNGGGNSDVFITKLNGSGGSLIYSTYLGGTGRDDGYGIAVDVIGNVYVTGVTDSNDFPTQSPFQGSLGGGIYDAFVSTLDSTGGILLYSTYLGGNGGESGYDIAVDGSGSMYVTGATYSADFPTQGPFQSVIGGNFDVFVTKFDSVGSGLAYSTYLGGTDGEIGRSIAVDANGNAYITGWANDETFPTVNPFQATNGGSDDAFVAKLNSTGDGLLYSTCLGGNGNDFGYSIAVDSAGHAYVTGEIWSTDFPLHIPYQDSIGSFGFSDAFVTKFDITGTSLIFSTYLGGSRYDYEYGIAVDAVGDATIAGRTLSSDFPLQNPFQGLNAVGLDVFVAKLNQTGSALIYSTYLGGENEDGGYDVAVDITDNTYVVGRSFSSNFPTYNPLQSSKVGRYDAFVTKFNFTPCCVGATGNVDCDTGNGVDFSDLSRLIDFLYISFSPLCCVERANADGDLLNGVDISDLSRLIDYLYISFAPMADCKL